MKKNLLLILFFISYNLFGVNPPNDRNIHSFIISYLDALEGIFNKNKTEAIYLNSSFFFEQVSDKELIEVNNDFYLFDSNFEIETDLATYVLDFENQRPHTSVEINRDDIKAINIDCPITVNSESGEVSQFVLVSFRKKITYRDNTKELDFIAGVHITKPKKKIDFFLFKNVVQEKYPKAECLSKEERKESAEKEVQNFSKELYKKAQIEFKKKRYVKAKKLFEQSKKYNIKSPEFNLDIESKIIKSNQAIENNIKDVINNLIDEQKYELALQALENINDDNLKATFWHKESKKKCKNKIEQKTDEKRLKKANLLFRQDNFKRALKEYQSLLKSNYLDKNYIENQINKCEEADPNFIQKKLNIADKEGLKSKKNWLKTFKTYYKYEHTGLLRADQYFFMMIMMLDKKYSRVGKPMGFTRKKMNLLSMKYFYEAKNRGYNVSYEENHIFTQSITKFKNNGK